MQINVKGAEFKSINGAVQHAEASGRGVAVVDGVVRDTHDSSRDGTRCVYGFWFDPKAGGGA
jgi:hypothetical protein